MDARLDGITGAIELIDKTTGANLFKVEALGGSLAAVDLGLVGQTTAATLSGKHLSLLLTGATPVSLLHNGEASRPRVAVKPMCAFSSATA